MSEKYYSPGSFPIGETAQERGLPYVSKCYETQPFDTSKIYDSNILDSPIIDLADLTHPTRRSILVQHVADACRRHGFFQVKNHGIPEAVVEGALSAASGFFDLGNEEKAKYMSSDVHKPVRYGSSVRDGVDNVQFWRVVLKHYAHPLNQWISMWPSKPPYYKEKMGKYVEAVQKVSQAMMGLITESLGLGPGPGPTYLTAKLDQGMQVMTVNSYPRCPQPELAMGLPPHTDYGCLAVVLQDSPGLQIHDSLSESWMNVPVVEGTLHVHIGDQLEVLTNGRCRSVLHRVVLSTEASRISVAALHTLGMDETAAAVPETDRPNRYRPSTFRDFLDYIAEHELGQGESFLDTLKIHVHE